MDAKCDKCNEIAKPNDQNDVITNSLSRVYCERCYQDLISIIECWESSTYKIIVQRIDHDNSII